MTNEQILKKAIEKAEKNGWIELFSRRELIIKPVLENKLPIFAIYGIIFHHSFAKAFWGEEIEELDYFRIIDNMVAGYGLPSWQYHLQQMVILEEPLKYLEKFL